MGIIIRQITKMGFIRLRLAVKAKSGRGRADPAAVIDACHSNWSMIHDALTSVGPEDEKAIREYFNTLVDDEDDLGDILFGEDADDFKNRLDLLDAAQQKEYTNALIDQE